MELPSFTPIQDGRTFTGWRKDKTLAAVEAIVAVVEVAALVVEVAAAVVEAIAAVVEVAALAVEVAAAVVEAIAAVVVAVRAGAAVLVEILLEMLEILLEIPEILLEGVQVRAAARVGVMEVVVAVVMAAARAVRDQGLGMGAPVVAAEGVTITSTLLQWLPR